MKQWRHISGYGLPRHQAIHPQRPGHQEHSGGERDQGEDRGLWPDQGAAAGQGVLHRQRARGEPHLLVRKTRVAARCRISVNSLKAHACLCVRWRTVCICRGVFPGMLRSRWRRASSLWRRTFGASASSSTNSSLTPTRTAALLRCCALFIILVWQFFSYSTLNCSVGLIRLQQLANIMTW